jgi:hypothetical protein
MRIKRLLDISHNQNAAFACRLKERSQESGFFFLTHILMPSAA